MRYRKIITSERVRKEYRDYTRGKRIVFVGPGSIMKDRKLGNWIDNFDIVIRTNHFPVIMSENKNLAEDVGTRTDILYMNGHYYKSTHPLPYELYKKINLKWLCMKRCGQEEYSTAKKFCKVRLFNRSERFMVRAIEMPLTGVIVAHDILKNDPAELCYTGIDFYKDAKTKIVNGTNKAIYSAYISPDYIPKKIKKNNVEINFREGKGHNLNENSKFLKSLYDEKKITMPDFIAERMCEVAG